jgi:hypothetical protein
MRRPLLNQPTIMTLLRIVLGASLFTTGGAAFAEDYPVRPIKLIVPYRLVGAPTLQHVG